MPNGCHERNQLGVLAVVVLASKSEPPRESKMSSNKLAKMSVEELWTLHTEVASVLRRKIADEKLKLDARLREVRGFSVERERRPYPKVLPKYHNPKNPEQTWSGRGKQPRWLAAQVGYGKNLDQF